MRSIKKILLSPRLVVALISLAALSCLIAVIVPQLSDHPPRYFENWRKSEPALYALIDTLQLNNVYTSAWFLTLTGLFTLSLSLTVWDQGRAAVKAYRLRTRQVSADVFSSFYKELGSKQVKAANLTRQVSEGLRENGFRVAHISEDNGTKIAAVKYRIGRWGNFILHAGLLLIILAALYNLTLQQRGFYQLMENETFLGKHSDWVQSRSSFLKQDFDLGFQVHLKKLTPEYWENNKVKGLRSDLRLSDDKGSIDMPLEITSPIKYKRVTIFQSYDYGYAVAFVLTPRSGSPILTQFCLDATGRRPAPFAGKSDFPTTDYYLRMKFYPDWGIPISGGSVPAVDLRITRGNSPVFEGRMLYGQRVRIGEDTLQFAGFNYWSGLIFVKNSGITLIYIGFAVALMGAFFIYFLVPQEIHAEIEEHGGMAVIKIGGLTRKYPALFREKFDRLCEDIAIKTG